MVQWYSTGQSTQDRHFMCCRARSHRPGSKLRRGCAQGPQPWSTRLRRSTGSILPSGCIPENMELVQPLGKIDPVDVLGQSKAGTTVIFLLTVIIIKYILTSK